MNPEDHYAPRSPSVRATRATPPGPLRAWLRIIAVALAAGQATYLVLIWQNRRSVQPRPQPNIEAAASAVFEQVLARVEADGTGLPPEQRYAHRTQALRLMALTESFITYRDVIEAAYGAGAIDASLLARKATWRRRMAGDFAFLADYSLISVATPVREVTAVHDENTGETWQGMFALPENLILIATTRPVVLFHEVGHVLQQNVPSSVLGLVDPNLPNTLDDAPEIIAAFHAGRIDDARERRLRYLTAQKEFEPLLQDLNRLHAVMVADAPIMTPNDAIRALHAIGMPQTRDEVEAALEGLDWSLSVDDFAQLTAGRPLSGTAKQLFADAAELTVLRSLALRTDAGLWHAIYRKILFEAPGHL